MDTLTHALSGALLARAICVRTPALVPAAPPTLPAYPLLTIGLKGGLELSRQPLAALAPQVAACVALGFAIPFLLYPVLRALRLPAVDAAAVGAHCGSW